MDNSTHLVFLPSPGFGHLISTVEMAKVLVDRDHRLSITVLVMKLPSQSKNHSYATNGSADRIQFIDIPHDDSLAERLSDPSVNFMTSFMDYHKPEVRKAIAELTAESTQLAGIVVDMFCTPMIDIADEFGIPSYAYFTSSASFLGLVLHLQKLHDEDYRVLSEFTELRVPSFINPFPVKLLPHGIVDNTAGRLNVFLNMGRGLRKVKGILVNTLVELESHAIGSITSNGTAPPIYPVGPILTLNNSDKSHNEESDAIISWLDEQPQSSVLFLCFGSLGGFESDQVREIAKALELSGRRFLWSLRRPPQKGTPGVASNDDNTTETLPEGFLERTGEIGKVIGWAPQAAVLSHPAVGGFVSHCGWNSTLESLWYGVPVAAWPMYAEQQMNAFHLLKELGIAVEIKMDYKMSSVGGNEIVTAEEIVKSISQLMDTDGDGSRLRIIRKKVKEISEKCRLAAKKDGSSYNSIGSFIQDVVGDTK